MMEECEVYSQRRSWAHIREAYETSSATLAEICERFGVTKGALEYVVPAETETEITRMLTSVSPIRAIAGVRQVSASVYKRAISLTGPATGWVGETAARPTTNSQTLAELIYPTMELYAMPAATSAFLDDAAVDVGQWIADEVNTAFAAQETTAFVSGDGVNSPLTRVAGRGGRGF